MSSPKKNTAYVFNIALVDSVLGGFKVNPTIAAGDFQRSIGGGAYANLATLPVVEPASSISVKVSLSAAEMNASNGKTTIKVIDVAGGEWDDVFVYLDYDESNIDDVIARLPSVAIAAKLAASASVIIIGAAVTGTLSTTQMTTDLAEDTDIHYLGRVIIWTSGVLLGQATVITGYIGATKLFTYNAVTEAPSDGDTFVIV